MPDPVLAGLSPALFAAAVAVTLAAGLIKGAVGFAMPLVMISAFSSFLPPTTALAALILPTLAANISQAFRQGPRAAIETARDYRRFALATVICIGLSAPILPYLSPRAYLLVLGLPVTAFAALQLLGLPMTLRLDHRTRAEWALGAVGGFYGGLSGIWGPPLLVYLLSTATPKSRMILAQGVIYLIGSVALLLAHLGTGVLAGERLALSALLVAPALIGMAIGFRLQDRLSEGLFRKLTQALLVLSGLNLLRQAWVG